MILSAPPGQAGPRDIVSSQVENAVIEQARRRARRRQAAYAAVVGLVLVGAMALLGSRDAPPTGGGSGAGDGATAVGAEGRAAQLVDSFQVLHVGWLAVYADGRVIRHAAESSYGELDNLAERRLSPSGMAQVRAHTIDWRALLAKPSDALPSTAWAEPAWRPHVPPSYAVCLHWVASGFTSSRVLAVTEVPAPARAVLEGRPLARGPFLSRWDPPQASPSPPSPAWNCIEVDRAGIAALARTSTLEHWGGTSRGIMLLQYPDGSSDIARVLPVLPHGEFDAAGG